MARIFVSYRREDTSGYTGRLVDSLRKHFPGQIFVDLEAIEPGTDFVDAIDQAVDSCAALLVVIGRKWLDVADAGGRRRLEDPEDFVRLEVAAALERDARVIPVLVNDAVMPTADVLPSALAKLARRQAHEIGDGKRWPTDIAELIRTLERIPGVERSKRPMTTPLPVDAPQVTKKKPIAKRVGLALVGLFAALFVIGLFVDDEPDDWSGDGTLPIPAATPFDPTTFERTASPPSSGEYSASVAEVQALLSQLGYSPGPVDGLLGRGTTEAIRDFQDNYGHAITGRISPALLDQLGMALEEDADWTSRGIPTMDLTGTWYDNAGVPMQFRQNGSSLEVYGVNPAIGNLVRIASGTARGGQISVSYANQAGLRGTVQASLAPDGAHLNGTDTDSSTGYTVATTFHREHMPSH